MASNGLIRAAHLYSLQKYALAVKEADSFLAEEPQSARAHAIKALALVGQKRTPEALASARQAVALSPQDAFGHHVLSLVHLKLTKDDAGAEAAAQEALRLNPRQADHYHVLAQLRLRQGRLTEALALCTRGLQADPRHADCLAMRREVLAHLGQPPDTDEARAVPPDPQALANEGWERLQAGDYRRALASFRDALRLQPGYGYARDGLRQALQARRFLFRQYLRYAAWLDRLGMQARWLIFIGLLVLMQLLSFVPALRPVVMLLSLFAISTWLVGPLHNVFLRFDPYGKHLLTRSEALAAELVAGVVLLAAAAGVSGLVLNSLALTLGAFALLLLCVPVAGTAALYQARSARYKKALLCTLGLGALVGLGFALLPLAATAAMVLFGLALVGGMLFGWLVALGR